MYAREAVSRGGLGLPAWVVPAIVAGAGAGGTILAAKIAAGASTPKQEDIERQIRLQHQLELERAMVGQQQFERTSSLLMPAIGVLALVMLLR